MADARKTYADALTEEMLFSWHTMLLKDNKGINVGRWRSHTAPMRVISGAIGREKCF